MMDYPSLLAVATVVREGSFERAAMRLNVTTSAISQRIKLLEERLGIVLIVRGHPCTATPQGHQICRHMELIGILEDKLKGEMAGILPQGDDSTRLTIKIATSADSLGTWFLKAVANFTRQSRYLVEVVLDDQDHTANWLRKGEVLAAVTALDRPVQGCRSIPIGRLVYHATATPAFCEEFFPDGVTPESLSRAPAFAYNAKDQLQRQWAQLALGADVVFPTHWLPSTHAFVDASLCGMGWGMNPVHLVEEHLKSGALRELIPGVRIELPLFWQVSRMAAQILGELTRAVIAVATQNLAQPALDAAPAPDA